MRYQNKESRINLKKKLEVEGQKFTDQQIIAETFNEYFDAISENIKRQSKNNLIIRKDHNNSIDNHTHFKEPALYEPYPNMKCNCTPMKEIEKNHKISQNVKLVWVR